MWRYIQLNRLCECIARGSLEWWNCPRTVRTILRARSGRLYDWRRDYDGRTYIAPRPDLRPS